MAPRTVSPDQEQEWQQQGRASKKNGSNARARATEAGSWHNSGPEAGSGDYGAAGGNGPPRDQGWTEYGAAGAAGAAGIYLTFLIINSC